ncbi:MAG: lysophospholipid acyltransferase family protein [Elusimicrobiota bacterium]|jgi:predicted LPLAT superfamily acyltransferase|nr:lysophospholipid acyltransferase family protein [Elusimicrobiota bacterium]
MEKNWTGKSKSNPFLQFLLRFSVKIGGAELAYFFLLFVCLIYTLLPSVLKSASFYLKRRFPQDNFFKRLARAYKLNFTFGRVLIDRTVYGIKGDIKVRVSKEDMKKYSSLAEERGLILLTSHCGAWQMAMPAFNLAEFGLSKFEKFVLYKKTEGDIDKHSFELSGEESPVNFIDPAQWDGGALSIISALQRKSIVCIMGDRIFGSGANSARVDFLGGKIDIPLMPYRIAASCGVPVIIVFFPYKSKAAVDPEVEGVFHIKDKGAQIQNYYEDAQVFADALSKFTKKYPYQFFNYFNIWRQE